MAIKTITSLIDDIDGGPADQSIVFGIDGKMYEIDLNNDHAEHLRNDLAQWITNARPYRGGNTPTRRTQTSTGRSRAELDAIRAWAREQGMEVKDRGRISVEVVNAYDAAHSKS